MSDRFQSPSPTPAVILLSLGAFIQIFGGNWDIIHHTYVRVDTFFTIQHLFLYTGVALVALAATFRLALGRRWRSPDPVVNNQVRGLNFGVAGAGIEILAGPIDFWWHGTYGFDPVLFSPPHILLILGISLTALGALIGSIALMEVRNSARLRGSAKVAPLLMVLSGGAVWASLTVLVYALTDVGGVRFQYATFTGNTLAIPRFLGVGINVISFGLAAVPAIFAMTTVRRYSTRLGPTALTATMVSLIGALSTLFEGLLGAPNLTEAAIVVLLPLAAILLIPGLAFDRLAVNVSTGSTGRRYLLACLLIAPMTYFYDVTGSITRTSLGFVGTFIVALPFLLVFGLVAHKTAPGFVRWLTSDNRSLA